MRPSAPVDYALIRGDFAFFLAHSTETEAQIAAFRPHLARLARQPRTVRLLDFGCGDGRFIEQLLRAAAPAPHRLALNLVEPVEDQLAEAAARLAPLAGRVAAASALTRDEAGAGFDLILANHSLYYVPDPAASVAPLLAALAPGGRLIAALLDRDNALARIWQAAFAAAGVAFPFPLAEDIEAALRRLGITPSRETIAYTIAFPDTREAQHRILRFLLGANLEGLPDSRADALFAPYRRGGMVMIETAYPHLIVQRER
jgi:SAM-dependent methyltransferase